VSLFSLQNMSELVLYMALLLSGIVGSYLKRVAFLYVPYRPLYIMYMQARAYADVQGTFPILHSQFPVFNSLVTTTFTQVNVMKAMSTNQVVVRDFKDSPLNRTNCNLFRIV